MHIKSFFANIQNMTLTESVLALSRVFDKPNNRFPNRCILGLINKLSTSAEDAPKIIETYQTIEQLKIHGMPELIIRQVENGNHILFAKYFSYHMDTIYQHDKFRARLKELKTIRDKVLAHNEQTTEVCQVTWTNLDELIGFAHQMIGIVGWAYFSTVYMFNGKYELTEYSKSFASDIACILKDLNVIKNGA
jgi:hypothetical protein